MNESLKDIASEKTDELLAELERELGLAEGFSDRLLAEDDWSFIVKTHAMIEGAVGHSVERLLRNPKIQPLVRSLQLNGRVSKLSFLMALDPIDKSIRRFITELSRLRNLLVHDITQTAFSLPEYVGRLQGADVEDLVHAFASRSAKERSETFKLAQRQIFLADPKRMIWRMSRFWVARLYLGAQHQTFKRVDESIGAWEQFTRVIIEKSKEV